MKKVSKVVIIVSAWLRTQSESSESSQIPRKNPNLVCATGALAVALLPETLGARLPETLEEATEFGAKDKFFSFLPSKYRLLFMRQINFVLVEVTDWAFGSNCLDQIRFITSYSR